MKIEITDLILQNLNNIIYGHYDGQFYKEEGYLFYKNRLGNRLPSRRFRKDGGLVLMNKKLLPFGILLNSHEHKDCFTLKPIKSFKLKKTRKTINKESSSKQNNWSNDMIDIFNDDCIDTQKRIGDNSVDLGIYDPPFGLKESGFDKHYKRDSSNVISGYKEAPDDYEQWTYLWMSEAKRVLKEDGSMFVFMGHTNLREVLNAAHNLGLYLRNHIIWKYNFGVNTKKKFVTSHYHILYYTKSEKSNPTFNLNCRYGFQEIAEDGGKALYDDLEDVWTINRDYSPGELKNQNKLPEELIKKIIQYSSNKGDMVCDFFMGNFTTAYSALKLGRRVCGFEINKNTYDYHIGKVSEIEFGCDLSSIKVVNNLLPANQGKPISQEESENIYGDYYRLLSEGKKKKDVSLELQNKYQRGKFAIKNILDKIIEMKTKVKENENE